MEEFESKNEIRRKIEKKIIEYIHKYYNKKITIYNVFYDSNVDNILVLICGQNIN